MPSRLTWNQENTTTAPVIADQTTNPKSRTSPLKRACSSATWARQIINAPFSLGSHPQKRPHESLAQTPPRIVPTTANARPKQVTP